MSEPRRVLIVEDSPDDAELSIRALRRAGIDLTFQRVQTPETMRKALAEGTWDLVISDYSMPRFNGLAALKMLRESGLDLPFILVSGTVGEDAAVEAMKRGADDYILKSNLARLPLAVERELRDSEVRVERNRAEARYRSLVDRVPVGLFRVSPEGKILEANPALIEMLGFSDADSLKQTRIRDLWLRPEEHDRAAAIIASDGIVQNFEIEVRRPDGSVTWCEESARAVYDPAGKIVQYEGVLVDVTSRKLAEAESNRARDRVRDLALETARLRSEFLANMSHEIRTPLVGIIGTGELLSHSELTHEQRRLTEIIRSSGELLLTVVNDILDFSKLAAGRVVLEKLDFDLVDLTENLIDTFALAARAKGIELALQVDVNLPTGLKGDPSRLRQVLNNLVANAIKFTEKGDVIIRAKLVEGTADDVIVRFEVVDTGIGIPYEMQGRLFQPFVQAEASTNRRFGGTGLGLVIAAKLVEQMGGEIGFESEPRQGSNFHFTARIEKGTEIIRPWMAPTAVSCFNGIRAIVITDSPATREVICGYLSSWGSENVAVGSGAEALEILKLESAGHAKRIVALIDEQTPDMGALRLARAIKDQCGAKHGKVIMFSAETGGRSASDAVDASITKPLRPSNLFSCLLELFGDGDCARIETVAAAPRNPGPDEQPQWRKAVRVLLVDDNLVNRTIGAKQLSALGYAVEVVDSARQGLAIVAQGSCDLVLMDCEMPEMDGYEAVAELRRREGSARHTVVIALTAHATADDRARCLDAGMDDYLSKPIKLQVLAEMLDTWVTGEHDHIATRQQ
ncbi:response regulator [Candidatus Binatus sp.]|uniref:hybrid sensor histidine kinase/response regulator n=1 Tax=Candidatus Binatus sp. TaxID=2811406 RepID=UPI003C50A703